MIEAARVARTFRLDPVLVLAGAPDRAVGVRPAWLSAIRVAAHNVIAAEERLRSSPVTVQSWEGA